MKNKHYVLTKKTVDFNALFFTIGVLLLLLSTVSGCFIGASLYPKFALSFVIFSVGVAIIGAVFLNAMIDDDMLFTVEDKHLTEEDFSHIYED
jgi:hypothetical protein